jgi:hypothetical protein
MDNHLLRIATINYYDILLLLDGLNKIHKNFSILEITNEFTYSQIKQYFLEIAEDLDSCNVITHYNALTRLLFSFIINKNFNFMFDDNLETNFNIDLIKKSLEYGLLEDLIKNLNFFITKFSEFQKK